MSDIVIVQLHFQVLIYIIIHSGCILIGYTSLDYFSIHIQTVEPQSQFNIAFLTD